MLAPRYVMLEASTIAPPIDPPLRVRGEGLRRNDGGLKGCPEVQAGCHIVPQTKVDVGQSVVSHKLEER